jgi:DNA-nicking Smr family endonuclease
MDLVTQIQCYEKALSDIYTEAITTIVESPGLAERDYNPENYNVLNLSVKAEQIFERVLEADALLASLPVQFSTSQQQMETLQQLQEENDALAVELDAARAECKTAHDQLAQFTEEASTAFHAIPTTTTTTTTTTNSE